MVRKAPRVFKTKGMIEIIATGETKEDARVALEIAIASALSNVEYGDQDMPEGSTASATVIG